MIEQIASLLWPIIVIFVLLFYRKKITCIFDAITERIKTGASFEAGPIKLGANTTSKSLFEKEIAQSIYLNHTIETKMKDIENYYMIKVFLDSDTPKDKENIEKVVYHLHSSFNEKTRTVYDKTGVFSLLLGVHGEFNIAADVVYKDGKTVKLERYLNLGRGYGR